MAAAIDGGNAILKALQTREVRDAMIDAAERGIPPVTVASVTVSRAVGSAPLSRVAKQFTGLAISAILAEEGFVLERSGVRIRADRVFGTGAVYRRRVHTNADEPAPVLQRLLNALNPDERRWALRYLTELEKREMGS